MAIQQLTVFVENRQGSIVSITETLSKHNVNIRALSIAETEDFGILRLIVNDKEAAQKTLLEEGYLIKVTDVVGVKIGDAPGKLSEALDVLDKANINIAHTFLKVIVPEHAFCHDAMFQLVPASITISVLIVITLKDNREDGG